MAIFPWIGYESLYLARDFAWLPGSVRFREGKNASDALAALGSGRADAGCLTLDEMLRGRAAGVPLTAAVVFDVSAGADMVLARPGIERVADLAHKRLGLEKNALGALVLAKLLQAADLPASAISLLDVPPDRQLAAWRNNEVDALITFEPAATLLRREGAQNLFDSRQMPDTIFDVLAVRRDRVRDAAVQALVSSHFRALDHIRTNQADAVYRIAAREGIEPAEVRQVLSGVLLPSLTANRGYLGGADSRLLLAARTLSALMARDGLLSQEDALDELVTPAALPDHGNRLE